MENVIMEIMGVDVGGSGVKGAPVNTITGELLAERIRVPLPRKPKPADIADAAKEIMNHFSWHGPAGYGFPSAVRSGVILNASNIHKSWIGIDAGKLFAEATGCKSIVINDADAAGMAEMTFGAGKGRLGSVLMITIGTGLGTALFVDGSLVPNLELGHIEVRGKEGEKRASDYVRRSKKLSWKVWARRFDEYLRTLENLLWPELIILGGGASKSYEKFVPYLTVKSEVVVAKFFNDAGIIGAAMGAKQKL
jgi:polyphosphate glucokinase